MELTERVFGQVGDGSLKAACDDTVRNTNKNTELTLNFACPWISDTEGRPVFWHHLGPIGARQVAHEDQFLEKYTQLSLEKLRKRDTYPS